MIAQYPQTCYHCGASIDAGAADVDHLVPRASGGQDERANRVPACQRCNRSRQAAPPTPPHDVARHHALARTAIAIDRLARIGIRIITWGQPSIGPLSATLRVAPAPGLMARAVSSATRAELAAALRSDAVTTRQDGPWLAIIVPRQHAPLVPLANMPAWPLAPGIGIDSAGRVVALDLTRMPHALVAGQTGSGKSTLLRTIATGLARARSCELALADSDVDTWRPLHDLACLLAPVAEGGADASALVCHVAGLLDSRDPGNASLVPLVLIVDEVQALSRAARRALDTIAAGGRKRRIHAIVATQYVRGDVLSRLASGQLGWRVAGRVEDATASRQIGVDGAEHLSGIGDFLARCGSAPPVRFRAAYGADADYAGLPRRARPWPTLARPPDRHSVSLRSDTPSGHPAHARAHDDERLAWAIAQIQAGVPLSQYAMRRRWGGNSARNARVLAHARELAGPPDRLTAMDRSEAV
jgi:energy-coupling factor transporter ATP-binding protein EcfA2